LNKLEIEMNFPSRLKDPNTLIRIGLVFLIIAGLSRWFLRPADFSEGVIDAAKGFLYGVAIACLLLGLWKNRGRTGKSDRLV
jgi:hypothetical protein